MRKLLLVLILFVLLIFGLISLFNVFSLPSKQLQVEPVELLPVDEEKALSQLSKAIRIKSIPSKEDSLKKVLKTDLLYYLKQNFPQIHRSENVEIEELDNYIIFQWKGLNPRWKPMLFTGDLLVEEPDVNHLGEWKYSPFMGKVADGKIWGAGSMGEKSASIALLQAWEYLISDQKIPQRSMYLALRLTADSNRVHAPWQRLKDAFIESGIQPEAIYGCSSFLDLDGCLGLKSPIAWMGFAERQPLSLRLDTKDPKAISKQLEAFEKQTTMALDQEGSAFQAVYNNLLVELPFKEKWLLANKGWIGNWMEASIKEDPKLSTMFFSKLEILTVNSTIELEWKLHPNVELQELKALFNNSFSNSNIKWEDKDYMHKSSPTTGYAFEVLQTTIKQCLNNPIVLPSVEVYNGFYQNFHQLSPNCYQFCPYAFEPKNLMLLETNINQHLKAEEYIRAIGFYHQLLRNTLI